MTQCTNCGATLEPGATVCPACGTAVDASAASAAAAPAAASGPAASPPPAAAPMTGPAATAPAATSGTSTSNLMNFARGAKGIALLCFVLPWVTVSCAGTPLVRISGLNLATGSIPMPTGMPGAMPDTPTPGGAQGPDILVLLAAVLIIAGLVVTFVMPRRKAALAAIGACAIAAALIAFTVLVRIRGAVNEQMAQSGAAGTPPAGGNSELERQMQQQMEQMTQAISVDPSIGFWLTLIALIAAIVLNKMVHGRTDT